MSSVKKLASQKPHEAWQRGLAWPGGNWLLHCPIQQSTHASVSRTCACSVAHTRHHINSHSWSKCHVIAVSAWVVLVWNVSCSVAPVSLSSFTSSHVPSSGCWIWRPGDGICIMESCTSESSEHELRSQNKLVMNKTLKYSSRCP